VAITRGGASARRTKIAAKETDITPIVRTKYCRFMRDINIQSRYAYDQTRYEGINKQVLSLHPMVKVWEEIMPCLLDMNRSCKRFYHNSNSEEIFFIASTPRAMNSSSSSPISWH